MWHFPNFHVTLPDGFRAPFYALRFDAEGRSMGPRTQQHLVDALGGGTHTDIYLFSHGWNNDWATALGKYRLHDDLSNDDRRQGTRLRPRGPCSPGSSGPPRRW